MTVTAGVTPRCGVLLVNAHSRSGRELFERARAHLAEIGVEVTQAARFESVERLIRACRAAVKDEIPLLIVGGGDGTINACAGIVAQSKSAMGILPLGTGNAFAHDLGVPLKIEDACEVIRSGSEAAVDLGRIADRFFVNVATVGLSTEIAKCLTDPMKKRWGRFAYLVAVVRGIRRLKPFHARLETENGNTEFDCLQVVIGNGRYHGGPFPILPSASLQAGKFGIYALTGCRRSELIKYALMLPGGHHVRLQEIHSEYARAGALSTIPNRKVTVDGEVALRTPVRFESLAGALRVIVPDSSKLEAISA